MDPLIPAHAQAVAEEHRLTNLERRVEQLELVRQEVHEIRELLHKRPSWAVTIYLTLVTSVATGSVTALLVSSGG